MVLQSFVYDPTKSNGASEATVLTCWIDCKLSKLRRTESRLRDRQERYASFRKDAGPAPTYLNVDIKNAVGGLPGFEQKVCELLGKGYSKAEITERLNCTKATLDFAINTIRERLKDSGMDGWLRSK